MNAILFFIIVLLICLGVIEVVTLVVMGSYISERNSKRFMDLKQSEYSLNMFNNRLLSVDADGYEHTFISNVPFQIVSKYYIDGYGCVPRWSKLHKKIVEYYKNAKNNGVN